MNNKGVLTVISGFSGAGKGTVIKELVKKYKYGLSISATTRAPREGEIHGKEYFFLTREDFECMIEKNELIEWAEYVGNYYGTPKQYVKDQLDAGKDVILEIEVQGALQVKKVFPDAVLMFLTPPSAEILKHRLVNRGTETMDKIEKRLRTASTEATFMNSYDYLVVNDDLSECVENVHQIIENEHFKTGNKKEFIDKLKTELEAFKKGE